LVVAGFCIIGLGERSRHPDRAGFWRICQSTPTTALSSSAVLA
jgi:hypothetical protein